jgi:hypothetical protein
MGILDRAIDALKMMASLEGDLRRMSDNLVRVTEHVRDINNRLIRLESREDVTIKRAEAAAETAGSLSRAKELGEIRERIRSIEIYLRMASVGTSSPPILRAPTAENSAE